MKRLVVLIASALASAPVRAQMTPADSVRLRAQVASALLEFEWNYTRPVTLRLGEAGGSIPDSLVPSSFTILGGTGTQLVMESSRDITETKRLVNEHLIAKGLRVNEPWNPREEGFVFGSRSMGSSGRPVSEYCFGAHLLGVTVRPQFPGRGVGSMIQYRVRSSYPTCAPGYSPTEQAAIYEISTIEMPILRPPPGATSSGGGGGGGGNERDARAEVRSEMSTGEMIQWYAAQLSEQGWSVSQPAIVVDAAIVSARKKDKDGRDLQGILADVKDLQGNHKLSLRIERGPMRGRRP